MSSNGHRGFPVNEFHQRDHRVFQFVMSAHELAQYARVHRFGESSDGVNRLLDKNHALAIALTMEEEQGGLMLDSICGDLQGSWRVQQCILVPTNGDCFLSIDDGQHRHFAVTEILGEEDRDGWSFNIVATMGLDYETRLRIFRQQARRKKIDTKLDLAQRHQLDDWNTDAEKEAYLLLLWLNSEANSPLKGMIILNETVRRTREDHHVDAGISGAGLWNSLTTIMGKRSPIYGLPMDKRVQVCRDMIRIASETWPKAWKSPNHILTTARGINAVLKLMVSSPEFRGVIGDDFGPMSLRKAFDYAKNFKWQKDSLKNISIREITDSLDKAIGTARLRDIQTRGRT
jgi:hypothetical protein